MNYKNEIRDELKVLESLTPILSLYVPEKTQKALISRLRKLNTQPEAKYPQRPDILTELLRFDFPGFAKTAIEHKDTNPGHMDVLDIRGRLEGLCAWPKRMRDTYENRHPPLDNEGNPMRSLREYWEYVLKDKQTNKTTHTDYSEGQVEMDKWDGKKFQNKYKKYVKEWKLKHD